MDWVLQCAIYSVGTLGIGKQAAYERAKSIAAVKRTNGQLRLEQKLRELESEAWQG